MPSGPLWRHSNAKLMQWCRHDWKSRRIASRKTKTSLFTASDASFYFLHVMYAWQEPDENKHRSLISSSSPRETYSTSVLWRHTNARHRHCYVLLTNRSCKLKVAQSWYFMMTSSNGYIFRVTGHLCGEFTVPRWIPHTKASDSELWCFLWSASE